MSACRLPVYPRLCLKDELQDVLQRIRIRIFDRRQSFVQPGTDACLQMSNPLVAALVILVFPASIIRTKKSYLSALMSCFSIRSGLSFLRGILRTHALLIFLKLVVQAFEEQDAEDEFLEFRGIHVATQNIARLKQLAFQLRQRRPLGLLLRRHKRLCAVLIVELSVASEGIEKLRADDLVRC